MTELNNSFQNDKNNQLMMLDKTSYINDKNILKVFNILCQKYRFEYWDLKCQAVNVINNSYNHITQILSYIYKLKDGNTKKYTLRNYHEYNGHIHKKTSYVLIFICFFIIYYTYELCYYKYIFIIIFFLF